MKKDYLIEANSFFKDETEQFKREVEIEKLLVDIACEFINYRANNNLSQKDLAKELGISQAMISKLESGEYNPSVKMLFELAQKLGWNFSIRFNNVSEQYNYESREKIESAVTKEGFEKIGYAS